MQQGETPQVAVCLHSGEEANGEEEEIYDGKFAKAETRYGGTVAEFATIGETPFFLRNVINPPPVQNKSGIDRSASNSVRGEERKRRGERERVFLDSLFFLEAAEKR